MKDSDRRAQADSDRPGDDATSQRHPYLLLRAGSFELSAITEAIAAERIEARDLADPDDSVAPDRPAALLIDVPAFERHGIPAMARLVERGIAVVLVDSGVARDLPAGIPPHLLSAYVPHPAAPGALLVAIRTALREAASRRAARAAADASADLASEVTELTEIGIRLLTERDLDVLLGLILAQARRLTHADAGSLYLVETTPEGSRRLRFKVIQNDSRPGLRLRQFTVGIDEKSAAGYAALTGQPLVIADVHQLPAGAPFAFNHAFDRRHGYRTKSMLVIPMANHHGETIGVLQLINRKPDGRMTFAGPGEVDQHALPFDDRSLALAGALAGQAAVSIENSQLATAIERLFEGFVSAAITAIEQRDPATSGHSERVAAMTCALAVAADRARTGPFREIRFGPTQLREIRYAGLLHDFGKVGVRERVLLKARKLYPESLALIEQRHAFLVRSLQWQEALARTEHLERHGRAGYDELLRTLAARRDVSMTELGHFLALIRQANEPTVLPEGDFSALEAFAARSYDGIDGEPLPFLTGAEVEALRIRKGSLDEAEWAEMRRHVTLTHGFLSTIPWTGELAGIPAIAHGHHEKLDGSGYPRGLLGPEIPLQSRMMTVADIFDALTAADRPYKSAIPVPAALDVLSAEVRAGHLDPAVFDLFLEARIHERPSGGTSGHPGQIPPRGEDSFIAP